MQCKLSQSFDDHLSIHSRVFFPGLLKVLSPLKLSIKMSTAIINKLSIHYPSYCSIRKASFEKWKTNSPMESYLLSCTLWTAFLEDAETVNHQFLLPSLKKKKSKPMTANTSSTFHFHKIAAVVIILHIKIATNQIHCFHRSCKDSGASDTWTRKIIICN